MIKIIIAILIGVIVLILGINWYLQPNDLIGCDNKPSQKPNCRTVDAIVAVSGGDTDTRAKWAINLYKNGWADKLIFSGAASDKSGPSNAAVMKKLAVNSGVPSDDIYIDEDSATTGENAQNTEGILKKNDIKKIILVTSGYHQRRASLEFNKWLSNTEVMSGPALVDRDWSLWWWTNLRGWWLVSSEVVKILVFYIVGI